MIWNVEAVERGKHILTPSLHYSDFLYLNDRKIYSIWDWDYRPIEPYCIKSQDSHLSIYWFILCHFHFQFKSNRTVSIRYIHWTKHWSLVITDIGPTKRFDIDIRLLYKYMNVNVIRCNRQQVDIKYKILLYFTTNFFSFLYYYSFRERPSYFLLFNSHQIYIPLHKQMRV